MFCDYQINLGNTVKQQPLRRTYSKFLGSGENLGGTWHFMGGLDNPLETMLYYLTLINPYKFMTGYLYFPNNLKDIKDHIKL